MKLSTPPRARPFAAVLCALALTTLTACTEVESAGDKGFVTSDGTVTQVPPAERGDPVVAVGTDLRGAPLDLADFRGKVVVLNVWGAWCTACRAEMPDLKEAAQRTPGAVYLGINIRDGSTAQATAFLKGVDFELDSFYDPGGQLLLAFDGAINPRNIPTTVVLDEQGRTAAAIAGPIPSATTLVTLVEETGAESNDG